MLAGPVGDAGEGKGAVERKRHLRVATSQHWPSQRKEEDILLQQP